MKKKFISVLTALMVLSFSTTAFAATSPVAGNVVSDTVTRNEEQTQVTEVTATMTPEQYAQSVTVSGGDATISAVSQDTVNNAVAVINEQLKDVVNIAQNFIGGQQGQYLRNEAMDSSKTITSEIKGILNVNATIPAGGSVTLTFNVAGVKADSYIMLLHFNGTNWEYIPATVGNGTVTATFTSLSPIAIVELKAESKAAATPSTPSNNTNSTNDTNQPASTTTTTTTTTPTGVTSPKTGAEMPVVAVIAVICAAGAVVCTKKVTLNK